MWFPFFFYFIIHSFDVRDKSFSKPKHWSAPEVFGPRAKYSLESQPESLNIKVSIKKKNIILTPRAELNETRQSDKAKVFKKNKTPTTWINMAELLSIPPKIIN